MGTQHTFMLKKIEKISPIMPFGLALWLTLINSNYPVSNMIPKVFEPLSVAV